MGKTRRFNKDDEDEDDVPHEERDLDDIEPGESGDGRIIRKRLEDE